MCTGIASWWSMSGGCPFISVCAMPITATSRIVY